MVFLAPIIAILLVIWVLDAIYYTPKQDLHEEKKEKNITKKDEKLRKNFEKKIEN